MASDIRERVLSSFSDGSFHPDQDLRMDLIRLFSETSLSRKDFATSVGLSYKTFANFLVISKKMAKRQITPDAGETEFKPVLVRDGVTGSITLKFPQGFEIECESFSRAVPILEMLMELKR
jgi:hypothetical protein